MRHINESPNRLASECCCRSNQSFCAKIKRKLAKSKRNETAVAIVCSETCDVSFHQCKCYWNYQPSSRADDGHRVNRAVSIHYSSSLSLLLFNIKRCIDRTLIRTMGCPMRITDCVSVIGYTSSRTDQTVRGKLLFSKSDTAREAHKETFFFLSPFRLAHTPKNAQPKSNAISSLYRCWLSFFSVWK